MDFLLAPRYMIFLAVLGFSLIFYAFFVADLALNPKNYNSSFYQIFISLILIIMLGSDGIFGYYLFSPKETIVENEIISYQLISPPKQFSINGMSIDYLDEEGKIKHLVLESADLEKNNTQEENLKLIKIEEIKKKEFFILGKKIDEEKIKLRDFYSLENQ